jgi:hypothetical protein
MSWNCKIERADNGYLISFLDEYNSKIFHVIEEDDNDVLKEHEELHWWIMDYFGHLGSKHDKERLRIVREKRKDE